MLLTATTGFETFTGASAKAYAFALPSRDFVFKETMLQAAVKLGIGITKLGTTATIPAAPGLSREMGYWATSVFNIPDGMLVKLYMHRNGAYGTARVMASLILQGRATGPLQRVAARLTGHASSSISLAVFEGRFDVLSLHDALRLGAMVPAGMQYSYDPVHVARGFDVVLQEAQVAQRPVVETRVIRNTEGETVTVATRQRRRALDI